MVDELYINGERVDMVDSNIVNLKINSNILSGIEKIKGNVSYTVKLPATANNMRIIKMSYSTGSTSEFPYVYSKCTVLRDGIEIIPNGKFVLLAVEEQIEGAIIWGFNGIEVLKEKKLRDLPSDENDKLPWGAFTNKNQPDVDYGDAHPNYPHVVVPVGYVLNKISEQSGISFMLPDDINNFLADELVLPLLSLNDYIDENNAVDFQFANYHSDYEYGSRLYISTQYDSDYGKLTPFNGSSYNGIYTPKVQSVLKLSGTIKIVLNPFMEDVLRTVSFIICKDEDPTQTVLSVYPSNIGYVGSLREITYAIDATTLEMERNVAYSFRVSNETYKELFVSQVSGSINVLPYSQQIQPMRWVPIIPNLPDMTQLDFLKGIMGMFGLIPVSINNSKMLISSYVGLYANRSRAYDWSGSLCESKSLDGRYSFKIDGIAQKNIFKYTDDATVKGDYNGTISIQNVTIDSEIEFMKLPFAACDERDGKAYIPLYTYEGNEIKYNSNLKPRIIRRILKKDSFGSDTWTGTFDGLDWDSLLSEYYQGLRGLIHRMKVIEVTVRLHVLELKNLDVSVPVYLAQYGAYFAIVEIVTKQNDLCSVKLLKM